MSHVVIKGSHKRGYYMAESAIHLMPAQLLN